MQITITRTTTPKAKPDWKNLGFGKYFTDHMFVMDYTDGIGWHDARIVPYAPFALDPATMCLHYAQETFEGMKAYRHEDGSISLFRPLENIRRLNNSDKRLCIPALDEEDVLQAIRELVKVDADWVPTDYETSLYIRPFVFATDIGVGVHPSHTYKFVIILSPVGAYYPEGVNPVKIYVEDEYTRASIGGTGFTKAAANYAISLAAQEKAQALGYTQVLWLDSVEKKYVEEVGTMNVAFKINGTVITPALGGSILPGITRKSMVELLKYWGHPVEERKLSIDELIEAAQNGTLEEAFGTGTAAVISPIGELYYEGKTYTINNFKTGPLTQKIYDALTGIQWGKTEDPFGWVVPLETK
ncbi:MAG: branched-chain amino acid aminotransferase [Ruminococcaceae bacterium]|nr:branched-chain amino acid aminotransferase [Oscillospiraceae bacterium]